MNSTGKRFKKWFIPGIILLVIMTVTGYSYRGLIRFKMLSFLHSFDDLPETIEENTDMSLGRRWWPARTSTPENEDLTDSDREQLELLQSLGYLSAYESAPVDMGVTIYDTTRTFPGYNIVLSGHSPGASLMDLNGEEIHSWYNSEVSLYHLWPDAQDQAITYDYWRRAYLADNGDLTVVIRGGGVVRLDKDSNILWVSEYNGAHHDMDIDGNGNVYVLGRSVHINDQYSPNMYISEDYICILDSLGNEIRRISTIDALANSRYAPVLGKAPDEGDVLHCNTIEYIRPEMLPEDYTGPLRPGTVLLSHRTIDLVCAVDLEDESVYWAESNFWHKQHQPSVLSDGTMLVFDNLGNGDNSTVLQFDPETREILWLYRGDEEHPFFSEAIGSCYRLQNGNTIITESLMGRVFEVTPEGEIVWEFYNPHRAGDNYELIAILVEVFRVPPEKVENWL